MTSFAAIKRRAIDYINRYFAGALSAMDLHGWALAHPAFVSPKALNNDRDWALNYVLALMIALTDTAKDRTEVEEQALLKDRWPVGLLSTKNRGGS